MRKNSEMWKLSGLKMINVDVVGKEKEEIYKKYFGCGTEWYPIYLTGLQFCILV